MKRYLKQNGKYLLFLTGMCALIPHVMLHLIRLQAGSDVFAPVELEAYSLFFAREWVPFWAAYICYHRQQKFDDISFLPLLCTALILPTYLSCCDVKTVQAMALILPLLLLQESLGLLKKLETSEKQILAGLSRNRGMLRAFFFWTITVPCIAHICCAWIHATIVPLIFLPVPALLLFGAHRQLKDQPPTRGGILGILVMLPVTWWLVTSGPMAGFADYHLAIWLCGYLVFLLFQEIYHMDRWGRVPNAR